MLLATIVDWAALGQVVLYSFLATLLLTAVFTTGVLSLETGRARVVGYASFALCGALVALGLYVMFTSK